MSEMLASDLANPQFVGSTNPDALLHVEFYEFEPIDKWASEEASMKQQKRVVIKGPKQDFVRIMRPGDKDNILEVAVREEHKQRWPDKWMYYLISMGRIDGGKDVPGWRLEDWPEVAENVELMRDLQYQRYWTVEQLAGAQDHQIQKLGIGGPGLRERARVALRERMRKEFSKDLEEKERVIAEQGTALKILQEQVAKLMNQAPVAPQPPQDNAHVAPGAEPFPAPKKRGGRPKGSKNKPKVVSGEQHPT